MSASSATVYAYIGEMHVSRKRAAAIAWGSVFISFSFIILPGTIYYILIPEYFYTYTRIETLKNAKFKIMR